ncbi:MAG: NUDIX hydrolase [Caldilineales bacterium]|nr:NUDIX hydrolase [Caldilineales bacterium]
MTNPPLGSWHRLESRTVFRNRWLQVDIDRVRLPDGRDYEYTVIRRDRHGAAVLARDEQGRVLLQQEFRYPVGQVIWQLPGGLIDAAETPLAAARRELSEETGYVADRWQLLGVFWDNPALEDMEVHIFLAEGVRRDGREQRDEAEWVRCEWKDLAWVKAQVRAGVIRDRVVIAALGFLCAMSHNSA